MNKTVFVLLPIFLLLTACVPSQSGADTQTSPAPTALLTLPPPAATGTAFATVSPQPTGILSILRLQMIDANVGWAEGDDSRAAYLLRTNDGGETWQDVTPPIRFVPSLGYGAGVSLVAVDADTAWTISAGYSSPDEPSYTIVWRTTDGGRSWSPSNPIRTVSGSPDREFSPWLQFVDKEHGWLTLHFQQRIQSNDLQYRTRDGGLTWESLTGCATWDGARWFCDVPQFTDAQTGWLRSLPDYTSSGDVTPASIWRVQRTRDGGSTWEDIALPHSQEAAGCYQSFSRVGTGMVGMRVDCTTPDNLTESYYYLSNDQGQAWQIMPLPGKAFSLLSPIGAYETSYYNVATTANVFFLDMTTGWRLSAVENGYQLERTTDGGQIWQAMSDHLSWNAGFQFVDADHGWTVIADSKTELQRTTDGGKTWQKLTPRLQPTDPERSAIARMQAGDALVFQSIQMLDRLKGWAVGANGYIFHTDDGGKTWLDVTPQYGSIVSHREILVLDAEHAWTTITSPDGAVDVWSTEDSGRAWHPTNADSLDFTLLGENVGFRSKPIAVYTLEEFLDGDAALPIDKTTDGGGTWQVIDLPPMVIDPGRILLNESAYPTGLAELMQEQLSCREAALHAFSADTVGVRIVCTGAYRDVYGTYGYGFLLVQYYLSTDGGASWRNWMSMGHAFGNEDDHVPAESEFFLPNGVGWRLSEFFFQNKDGWQSKANRLLQTMDGGQTWAELKIVDWDEAQFDFVDVQEGWAIIKGRDGSSLVHTTDGGKTWEEIEPVAAP